MHRFSLAFLPALLLACAGRTPAPQDSKGAPGSAAPGPGESVSTYDLAHSGKPDVWKYLRKGPDGRDQVVRRESDLNHDGRIDLWEYYDDRGALEKQVADLDFDGKADVILFFEKGQLVRKELSFGFDGKPHVVAYYEKGKLVRKEKDDNGDGKIDTWEYWEGGELDRVGVDSDGDGKVDRWESRRGASAEAGVTPAPAATATPAARTK
jgi:hypothetical protein